MLDACVYRGDDNDLLRDAQHALYGHHVTELFRRCLRAFVHADRVLDAGLLITEKAKSLQTFDHRVLQDAHDIIAAAYRHEHDDGGQLQLWSQSDQRDAYLADWRLWFQHQLDVLVGYPLFVRAVVQAVVFSNSTFGYISEHQVCDMLITHYGMEDWAFADGYVKTYRSIQV